MKQTNDRGFTRDGETPELGVSPAHSEHESSQHPRKQSDSTIETRDETDDSDWDEIVNRASDESFPASDPPNWATGRQRPEF